MENVIDIFITCLIIATPALLSGFIYVLLKSRSNLKPWIASTFLNIFGILLGPTLIFSGVMGYLLLQKYDGVGMGYAVVGPIFLISTFVPAYAVLSFLIRQKSLIAYLLVSVVTVVLTILLAKPFFGVSKTVFDDLKDPATIKLYIGIIVLASFCSFLHWLVNCLIVDHRVSKTDKIIPQTQHQDHSQ